MKHPIICPCFRREGKGLARKKCEAVQNKLGVKRVPDEWREQVAACFKRTGKEERDQGTEQQAWFCQCGEQKDSKFQRDMHVAVADKGRHGPMPWEFPASGGAYVLVDMKSRKIMETKSFRLFSTGLGIDSSTVAEGRTVAIEMEGAVLKGVEIIRAALEQEEEGGSKMVLLVTDNDSTVKTFDTHLIKGTTEQRSVTSCLADPLRTMKKSKDEASKVGMEIAVRHDHNEHGRPWNAMRQTITCRLLRCCDSAAGEARRWEEPREGDEAQQGGAPNSGGAYTTRYLDRPDPGEGAEWFTTRLGSRVDKDRLELLGAIRGFQMADFLIKAERKLGRTARWLHDGIVHAEATNLARKQMSDETYEAAQRAQLFRDRWQMRSLETACHLNGDSAAKRAWAACGTFRHYCPHCTHLKSSPIKDSYTHGRFSCEVEEASKRAVDARTARDLMKEGVSWHHDPTDPHARGAWQGDTREKQQLPGLQWDGDKDLVKLGATGTFSGKGATTISGNRIRVWLAEPTLGERESLVDRGLRAAKITHTEAMGKLSYIGQIHYSLRLLLARVVQIEQEVLQTPFTMSAGIFRYRPTLDSAAVAEEDRDHWGLEIDNVAAGGPPITWVRNCVVCVKGNEGPKLRKILAITMSSVKARKVRVLVIVEEDTANCKVSTEVPERHATAVERHNLLSFPKGSIQWVGAMGWGGAWQRDAWAEWNATEQEGTGKQDEPETASLLTTTKTGFRPSCTRQDKGPMEQLRRKTGGME